MPAYFYAFYPKDETDRTLCVDTSAPGGLATAEAISSIPRAQICLRHIDREEFLRLAPAELRAHYLNAKPPGYGLSA